MELSSRLCALHGPQRSFAIVLVLCLMAGYSVGMRYLYITSDFASKGVTENYLGNEDDEEAVEMKFAMPEAKILTIIHTHILSYTFIFGILGVLLLMSSLSSRWKHILITEPLIMSLITFGGLYLLWQGETWLTPVIMVSGVLLTMGFYLSSLLVLRDLLRPRTVS